jgi:hypothetical protein
MSIRSSGRRLIPGAGVVALGLVAAGTALAQTPPPPAVPLTFTCDGLYRSQVYVDGQQTDWDAEAQPTERVSQLIDGEFQYDWTGPNDASFRMWCRHSEHGLYFAVVGRDNVLVAPDGSDPGDRLEVWLQLDQPNVRERDRLVMVEIPLWPALTDGIGTPTWGYGVDRNGSLNAARAEITQTETGFFAEFNIPYAAIGGYQEPYGPMGFALVQRDWDSDAEFEVEVGVGTAPVDRGDPDTLGVLNFQSVEELAATIRRSDNLPDSEQAFSPQFGYIGGGAALDAAFVLGDRLIIAGAGLDGLAWAGVTVRTNDAQIPMAVELVNVDSDPEQEILFRYRENRRTVEGQQMTQEFVSVFDLAGSALTRIVFQEVANEIEGVGRIESEMRITTGSISFRKAESSELTREQWFEVESEGQTPEYYEMINPWDSGSRVVWSSQGGQWRASRD